MAKKTELFGEEKTKKTSKGEITAKANGGEAPALPKKRGRKPGSTNKKPSVLTPKKGWVMIAVPAEQAFAIGLQIGSQQAHA